MSNALGNLSITLFFYKKSGKMRFVNNKSNKVVFQINKQRAIFIMMILMGMMLFLML